MHGIARDGAFGKSDRIDSIRTGDAVRSDVIRPERPFCENDSEMLFSRRLFLALCTSGALAGCSETLPTKRRSPVAALEPVNVQFAGVSFSGDFKDNEAHTPYAYAVSKEVDFDAIFRRKLAAVDPTSFKNFRLTTDNAGARTTDVGAQAFTFAIDLETVTVSRLGKNEYKVILDLYASLLFFDFYEKKVLNTRPIHLQYVTLEASKPGKKRLQELMRGMFTGGLSGLDRDLFDVAVERLQTLELLSGDAGARLKVRNVTVHERTAEALRSAGIKADELETLCAQLVTRSLVDTLGQPMLPYTKGQAIGAKMSGRFVNGDAYALVIPDGDYGIDLQIESLRTERLPETDERTYEQAFFTFVTISAYQPDLGKTYFKETLRGVGTALLLQGQEPGLKASYLETLVRLFDGFARNIEKPEDEWTESAVPPERVGTLETQFEQLEEMLEKCR